MSPPTLPATVSATVPGALSESPAIPVTQPATTQPMTQPAKTQPWGGFFGGPATQPTGLSPAPGGFGGIGVGIGTFPAGDGGGVPAGSLPATVQAVAVSRPAKEGDPYSVAFWCSVLLGVVLLGFWGIMIMRRRLNAQGESNDDAGFSLSELRAI